MVRAWREDRRVIARVLVARGSTFCDAGRVFTDFDDTCGYIRAVLEELRDDPGRASDTETKC